MKSCYELLSKNLTTVFLLFLFLSSSAIYAQRTGGVEISYPENAENLSLCEDPGLLTVQIQIVAPSGINSPFTVRIAMPQGIEYVPGSLNMLFGNPPGIIMTESNLANLRVPEFLVTRAGGFTIGNTIQFTIERQARDCRYYGASGTSQNGTALKDTIKVTTSVGYQEESDGFTNTYQVINGVLSISPISQLSLGISGSYTRDLVVSNGGLACVSEFRFIITDSPNVNHEGLTYNGVPLTLDSQTGNVFVYILNASVAPNGICPGETINLVETVSLNNCFAGNSQANYNVNWGCDGHYCQSFDRIGLFVADIGTESAIYTDEVITVGTFCSPATVRRTFTNNSSSPSPGLRDFLDLMISMNIGASSPVTLSDFFVVDNGNLTPLTSVLTESGGQRIYGLDFVNGNFPGLTDADNDGFADDLALGESITIEFQVHRACITEGCGATFPQTSLTSTLSYLSPCSVLAGTTTRSNINLTTPPATYSSDMTTDAATAPGLIMNESTGTITVGHNRRFENAFFEPCKDGSVTLTFELPDNIVLNGNTAVLNGENVPITLNGNMVSITGSYDLMPPNSLEILFEIPVTNECTGTSYYSPGYPVPYTITNTCHENCCTETWACDTIPPIRTRCTNGSCDPTFISVSEVYFQRATYGYADAYGLTPVNPATLSAASRNTVIHGDTLLVHSKVNIFVTQRDEVTFYVNIDQTSGVEPLDFIADYSNFIYTPALGSPITCSIPASSFERMINPGFYTYKVTIDPGMNGGTCFPAGFLFEPGSSVEIFTYYKVNEIPTHTITFPLGVNLLETTWSLCTSPVDDQEPEYCCGGISSFNYYNYTVEFRNFASSAGSICDTSFIDVGAIVYINGTRNNVFPNEVRPLVIFDDANFTVNGLHWLNDDLRLIRRGQDPSTTPITRYVNSTNGLVDNQNFVPVTGLWPITDDLGAINNNPAINGTEIYSFTKRYYTTCTDVGQFSRAHNIHYRLYPEDDILTHSYGLNGSLTPNLTLPTFINTSSVINMQGISQVQTWQLAYDANVTSSRRFGSHVILAVDNSISNGIEILDIYEVNSAGVRINQPITTVLPWANGTWAQINGGSDAGIRYFRVDYSYTTCQPDTARFYFGKSCNEFPDNPLDVTCGLDTRNLIVRPEVSGLQFYTVNQPTESIDLCTPLDFAFIYNSSLPGNVINPEVRLRITDGIDINSLSIRGRYPNATVQAFENLNYTIDGDFIVINLEDLANITPESGLPGLIQQPNSVENRQVRLEIAFTTDCNFVSGNSFELIANGEMPCGDPAGGDSTVIRTNKIKSNSSVNYEFYLVPGDVQLELNDCSTSLPVNFEFIVLGTQPTAGGEEITITLPAGVIWDASTFACASGPGTCPDFVSETILPDGRQQISLVQNNVLQQGTEVDFGFELNADPALIMCGQDLSIELEAVSYLENVPCETAPGGFCGEVSDIKLEASIDLNISLPDLSLQNFDYTLPGNGMLVTGDVVNNGGELEAGSSVDINFYCLDINGDPIGSPIAVYTLNGPLASGATASISQLLTDNCVYQNGVEISIEKAEPTSNCVCTDAIATLPVATQIVCPELPVFTCSREVIPPYLTAEEFVELGGVIAGFCGEIEDLTFELLSETTDSLDCNRTINRTYQVSDTCGNQSSCTQNFMVQIAALPSFDTLSSLPLDTIVQCDAVPEAAEVTATASCNQGSIAVTFTEQTTAGECPSEYLITRTWTAIDGCGDTITHVQMIEVRDTIAPLFVEVLPLDTLISCDMIPSAVVLTATDNCGEVDVLFTEERTEGNCPSSYTLTRTWTATDSCDNQTSHIQLVTVQDTTAPVFVEELPQDTLVNCDAVPEPIVLTATDNCGEVEVIFTEERTDGNCPFNYTLTRTWTATDSCDNETIYIQIVTVQDTTAPVFIEVLPQDTLVDCDAITEPLILTATDNCGPVEVTFTEVRTDGDCLYNFTLTRTWMVTDSCGNETVHIQIVTVQDTTAPVFVEELPQDTLVDCDAVPAAVILTATDNCGSPTVTFTEERTDGDCPFNYTLTRTWTAEDECGNQTIHTQIVTVQDTTAPVITILDPYFAGVVDGGVITIQCRAMEEDWVLPSLTNGEIEVTDNCGTPTFVMTQTVEEGSCKEDGYFKRIIVQIIATDECNNQSDFNFTILIVDTIPPVFTLVPNDTTLNCIDANFQFEIKAEDECECANISFTDTKVAGDCPGDYTITRVYTAKDCCGNMSFYTQTIRVVDNTSPVIIPVNPFLAAIENGGTITTYCDENEMQAWLSLPLSDLITAIDDCSGPVKTSLNITTSNENACWLYGYSKLITVTFYAEDLCGNHAAYSFNIEVVDTIAPKVLSIENFICEGDKNWPVAIDNCSDIIYSHEDAPVRNECNTGNNYIRTWTLSDQCGNTSYATQYVISNDGKAPVININAGPYKGFANGDTLSMECVDWKYINDETLLSWIGVEDNCDYVNSGIKRASVKGDCFKNGYLTIEQLTWVVSDHCGNTSNFTLNFKLMDIKAPVFEYTPKELTVDCINKIPPVRATDNCSDVKISVERTKNEGACINEFDLIEKYTAIDNCGNQSSFSRIIHVIDNTGPVINVPDVICEDEQLNIPDFAYDYCNNDVVKMSHVIDAKLNNCGKTQYYSITYTATDKCGNTSTKLQKVIKSDLTAPVIYFNDEFIKMFNIQNNTVVVSCESFDSMIVRIGKYAAVIVSDECLAPVIPVFEQLEGKVTCDENNIYKDHLFRWTAVDACGNDSTLELSVKMMTGKTPDWSFVPADTTIYCEAQLPLISELPDLGCGFETITASIVKGNADQNGSYYETRTWTIRDICGDETSGSQNIYHSMISDLDCSIIEPPVVECNSSNNVFTVVVTGGTGPYTYYWEVLNGSCHIISGQTTPTVVISVSFKTLQLKVTVTDANGCETECFVTVDCVITNPTLVEQNEDGIGEIHTEHKIALSDDLRLRPNPTSGKSYLEYISSDNTEVLIRVSDQLGRVIYSEKNSSVKGHNIHLLDLDKFAAGLYNVSIINGDQIKTVTLIKIR